MAPAHWVICKLCGKQFDVEKRGGYYDGNRYICKQCGKLVKKQAETEGLVQKSWFSRNWKIVIGIFFLIGGFGNIGTEGQAAIFGIVVGIGLLFWHYFPGIRAKKQLKDQVEAEQRAIAEQVKHCSTCGARTKGSECEYCGSVLT